MIRLSQASIRRPRLAIVVWLLLALGLGIVGSRIEGRFSPSILVAKGTESSRAQALADSRFGDNVLMPIMLTGPVGQLDRQGPPLVAKLRLRSDTRVISPWDGTPGSGQLRPRKTAATIVAAVARPEKQVIASALPQIERTVRASVTRPVTAHITGQASIDRAMRHETIRQTRIALLVAIPLVLLVLLAVLRAPVAALAAGGFAVSALPIGYGLTAIAASVIRVDAVAIAGASMVGLALGVGFGLLVVARFREALTADSGADSAPAHAAVNTAATAGRAVLIAGTAMVVAMVVATSLSMTEILNSIGIGATLMAFVTAAGAMAVLPAALLLLGSRVEAGAFARGWHFQLRPRALALPSVTAVIALVLIVPLVGPLLSLGSGPPDAKLLPSSSQARKDYEAVARVMGPGWVSPFEIVVAKHGSPVTTRRFLGQLNRFEKKTRALRDVRSVLGPGSLLANANELQGVPKGLNTAAATAQKSKKDLKVLIAGLQLATNGVAQVRHGLGAAAGGASRLHGGTGQAHSGSGQLKSGLDQAGAGARQLEAGTAQAAAGAKDLAGGLELARTGVVGGLPSIQKLIRAVNSNAKEVGRLGTASGATKNQIDAVAADLTAMTIGRDDPRYGAIVDGLQRAAASNAALAGAIVTAARNAQLNATTVTVVKQQTEDLRVGIGKLLAGARQLSSGLNKLSAGNSQLATGIARLDAGGAQLQEGLRQLNTGAGQLAAGLGSGVAPSGELLAGMHKITGAVVKARSKIPSTKDLEKLRREAPGLFDSGYFVLAAIDGAPRPARDAAAFVVNADQGGFAGRITVVPAQAARTDATRALRDRLSRSAQEFARTTGSQAAVGGTAADLIDYRNLGLRRLPVVIVALAALSFILLLALTRSFAASSVAVLLNLITAGAVFGVLSLLFGGDTPLLGGAGFVDPVTMIAVVTVVLALSIDYELFALARLRLAAGAGIAMLAVLAAFAPADVILIRQFAIGMAVAVAIDTFFVRRLVLKRGALRGTARTHI